MTHRRRHRAPALAAALAGALLLSACGGDGDGELSGPVTVDGSSTLEPLTAAAAQTFMRDNEDVEVTIGTSGSAGGFQRLCTGEAELADASRTMAPAERELCASNKIAFGRFQVANDAITLVVPRSNTWARCLTIDQLKTIWQSRSRAATWRDVDPAFPPVALELYGPGAGSGTYDYFTSAVNGTPGRARTDYEPFEDDMSIAQGVAAAKGGLGYFGYAHLEANRDTLKAVAVDAGKGCVAPSPATVGTGRYQPLSRPLFVYVAKAALAKPQVSAFVDHYLAGVQSLARTAGFVGMTPAQHKAATTALAGLRKPPRS